MPRKYVKKGGHGGKRPGAGQPPFEPTPEERAMVQAMVVNGLTNQEIADAFAYLPCRKGKGGIDVGTLEKYFPGELAHAVHMANISVTRKMYQRAVKDGNVQAGIWWLERRGGKVWKRIEQLEIGNVPGQVFNIANVNFSMVADEDLRLIRAGKITSDLIERLKQTAAYAQQQYLPAPKP